MEAVNPFESGARKVVPAVLIYPRWQDHVLMIHRDSGRPGDHHAGKWNGLGGKLELEESPLEASVRELREESGLELPETSFKPLGVLQFPNFRAHKNEDWVVWVYAVDVPGKDLPAVHTTGEGSLHWIAASNLLGLNLWPGDREFLPWVLERAPFIGTFWYEGQKLARTQLQKL